MVNEGSGDRWDFNEGTVFLAINHDTKQIGKIKDLVINYEKDYYLS
jgi:hypothetical protein